MAAIGIFDSGLGGLTVWAAIRARLPHADCLYLADQAHLPYGPRPDAEIQALAGEIARWLIDAGAGLIVVACNTASAAALETLRERFPATPFVGMEPAVKPAALHTRSGVVGLMATRGTLAGRLLRNTAARFAGHVEIVSSECPGLAEAIEAGLDGAALERLLDEHTREMRARGVDTVVLGCTHYPLITARLEALFGPQVALIDPAPAVARQVQRLWGSQTGHGQDRFLSTADPAPLAAMLARGFRREAPVESLYWQDGTALTTPP